MGKKAFISTRNILGMVRQQKKIKTFILVTEQAAVKLHFIFRPCQVLTGQPITHFSAECIIVFMMGIFACIFAVRSGGVKR